MTLPQIYRLVDYWEEHPPAHVSLRRIASLMGWKQPPKVADAAEPSEKAAVTPAEAIMAMAPGGFMKMPGSG